MCYLIVFPLAAILIVPIVFIMDLFMRYYHVDRDHFVILQKVDDPTVISFIEEGHHLRPSDHRILFERKSSLFCNGMIPKNTPIVFFYHRDGSFILDTVKRGKKIKISLTIDAKVVEITPRHIVDEKIQEKIGSTAARRDFINRILQKMTFTKERTYRDTLASEQLLTDIIKDYVDEELKKIGIRCIDVRITSVSSVLRFE